MATRLWDVGGNERDQVYAVLAALGQEFLFFFIGDIRQNEPVYADVPAGGEKALCAVGEDHVGIGHEHHGDGHIRRSSRTRSKILSVVTPPCRARMLAP